MAIALVALFFALGGIGTAATTAIVPLAKRALSADNAKKLSKKTLTEVVAMPGPGRTTTNTSSASIGPQAGGYYTASCDSGQTAISGGYSFSSGAVLAADTYPLDESTWRLFLVNVDPAAAAAVTVYVVCLDAESDSGALHAPASADRHTADLLERLAP
jgi:hypothetical protein